jgi:peptidoglycan LD-endopeptidase CwlK
MSAGGGAPGVSRDMTLLAPKFRLAVTSAIYDCTSEGLDAFVFEAHRSQELQALYYARGRTVKPPERPVTNAPTADRSWHYFGLAVDVISREHYWNRPVEWFAAVAEVFKRHGCKWGGDWTQKDYPHHQWAACKPSPSDRAREIYAEGGVEAVWQAVGAL